jgi:ribosomal protein S12 methylthiotransferase
MNPTKTKPKTLNKTSVGIVSLGCPKNLTDTEQMLGRLFESGYEIVGADAGANADVVIINTCGFLDAARSEAEETIAHYSQNKLNGQHKKIIVAGCMPTKLGGNLLDHWPQVDGVLGVNNFQEIVEVLASKKRIQRITSPEESVNKPLSRMLSTPRYRAYLKISEGCDHLCTFCTIPSIRGKHRSRPIEDIVSEANTLAQAGVKEITLIAQDSTYYGFDLYQKFELPKLLRALEAVDGIEWIRILYAYPDLISDELVQVMAESKKICRYLDMPLQHYDDFILKRMLRRGDSKTISNTLTRLRLAMPDIAIRTTFIVGFPGEQEEHFKRLLDFVMEAKFSRLGVFPYSYEESTPSARLTGQVDQKVKEERFHRVMDLQSRISRERNLNLVGKTLKVLVEAPAGLNMIGRTYQDAPEIDGTFILTGDVKNLRPGQFVHAQVTAAHHYDLEGRLVATP